ncbi:rhodanese-like domain-containing protein [Thermodesulfobacteriota bacterium]
MSHHSARKAEKLGYKNVTVFAAGYPAWKKIAGPAPKTAAVSIKAGGEEGSIDIENLKNILAQNPKSILLVDVRDKKEYEKGHFKGAVNITVDALEKNPKALSADKPIVFTCNTGAMSGEAFYMMKDLRPELKNVYYLDAACTYKKDGSFQIKKNS